MPKNRFIVACTDGQWVVSVDDGTRAYYKERAQAIRAAIEAAHASGESGHQAQVLAVDENNRLYPLWTYGVDGLAFVPSKPSAEG